MLCLAACSDLEEKQKENFEEWCQLKDDDREKDRRERTKQYKAKVNGWAGHVLATRYFTILFAIYIRFFHTHKLG